MSSKRVHKWPTCQVTGKKRLRDRKDMRLALRNAMMLRGQAAADGHTSTYRQVRGYKCDHCLGIHLTARQSPAQFAANRGTV